MADSYAVPHLLLAYLMSIPIAVLVLRKKAMDAKAVAISLAIVPLLVASGIQSYILMLVFLASSSALTRYKYGVKELKGAAERASGRTWKQVIGAGAAAMAFSAAYPLLKALGSGCPQTLAPLIAGLSAAIAASTADTWAAELGALSKKKPRLIVKPWVCVPHGVSGGVTALGELASLAGSTLVAATAAALLTLSTAVGIEPWSHAAMNPLTLFAVVLLSGYAGEVFDSVIGAVLQVKYMCPKCGVITDKKVHKCGSPTVYVRGFRCITNEVTNLISTFAAASLAWLLVTALA